MEKKDKDFLLEMKQTIIFIKKQIEELENKIDEHLQLSDYEDVENISQIIIKNEIEDIVAPIYNDTVTQENASEVIDTVENEVEEVTLETPVDNFLEIDKVPQISKIESKGCTINKAMLDTYTDRQAWRRDIPGTPVEDMRAAISLNDKILFINNLFKEDSEQFNNTISAINSMDNLQEVLDLIMKEHPEWDLDSEVVYRFMMAARRRVR